MKETDDWRYSMTSSIPSTRRVSPASPSLGEHYGFGTFDIQVLVSSSVFHQSRAQVDSGDTAYSMARWGVSIRACPLPTDCTQASTRPVVNSVHSIGQGDLPAMNVASAFAINSAE